MKEIRRLSRNVHESLRSSKFLFDLPRVVEELVYNSLDAGSTKVVVSLSVGSCYVKVEDDGCGVTRDGLIIVGERYATSKVHHLTDTRTTVETLGFRGEALSSISDISLIEIRSKARGKPNAYCKIIKSSKCLFFGIDDHREDVGTTVIVRDIFYNQPIRRKFMQSSLRKVLHYVKKCVFRIALVHPQVSFKVIDIEGEHKLLCTLASLSSLPLVTDGFGNEVSSSLREIISSGPALNLSGYISGPTDAFSAKVLQYIYINSRFVCKGPIHKLINSLATVFQSRIANWRDNSTNHRTKRQRTQGYPAYLLNLCCHMSSYDLSFEPSKTRVEFKDWGAILLFFEESIIPFWKQFTSIPFQGGSAAGEASFRENGREDMLSEGISKSSKLKVMKDAIPFLQGSNSSSRNINHVDTLFDDANNYHEHNILIDDQEDFCSLPMRYHSKDSNVEVVKRFSHREVNSLQGSSKNCKHSRYMSRKRREPCGIVEDHYNFPVVCDSAPSKTSPLVENERVYSVGRSTSRVFHTDNDFLKEPFSNEIKGIGGANLYNECLHVSNNLIFKRNTGDTLLQEKMNLQQPVIGVIRNCQKSTHQDTPLSFKVGPFFHDWAFLTEETNRGHGIVGEDVDTDSRLEYSFPNNFTHFKMERSHSAPPFYNGKKKFRTLNCLPTDYSKEKFTMKSSHAIDEIGSATDELDPASASLSKWRTGIFQPNGVIPHEVDVLDISSGLLHLSGNSLVPTSINKGCFENAKVLQQLDQKFIPVVASGTLVIIDQHAADERIRLEELREKVLHGDLCSSTYLNPIHELILPEMGYQLLLKYEEQIKKWGWIYNIHSQHSESFSVSMNFLRPHKCRATLVAVPHILGTDLSDKDLLEYIEQLVETDGSSMIPPAVIRILNYKACRGAIMFGDALLPSECSLIVEELKATSLCFQCAHGRPTTVPLLNMAALHEQLDRLGQPEEWHGLRRHTPSLHRARQRLELCENFVHR